MQDIPFTLKKKLHFNLYMHMQFVNVFIKDYIIMNV